MKNQSGQSLAFLSDISLVMRNQHTLKQLHRRLFFYALPLILVQWGTLIWAILSRQILIFLIGEIVIIPLTFWLVKKKYATQVAFVCPNCHSVFQPSYKAIILAPHTPKTRKLRCPHCHEKSYCLEVAKEK